MKITFIQTGGTIDKDYPRVTGGWAFEIGDPATARIIEKLNPSFEYELVTLCRKDSLEITDSDREDLAGLIKNHAGDKFIITHGTDTMMETATYLNERIENKLIIITGAMRPERFSNSDAAVNLGSAIAAASLVEKGVFIAMHGIVKPVTEIKRYLESGKYF